MNNDNMTTEGLAFTKGQLVTCVDAGSQFGLKTGEVYTFQYADEDHDPIVTVTDENGTSLTGFQWRFKAAEVFEKGDEVRVVRDPFYISWGERYAESGLRVGDVCTVKAKADSDGDLRVGDDWHAVNGVCLERVVPNETELAEWEAELMEALDTEDMVNHPQHYMKHPSGLEIIEITRHHNFTIGSALKYIFRHEHKGKPVEDLEKAIKYLQFQIEDIKKAEVAA